MLKLINFSKIYEAGPVMHLYAPVNEANIGLAVPWLKVKFWNMFFFYWNGLNL